MNLTANALTQHALRILDLRGYEAWRQPAHGLYDPTKRVYRANSVKKGISDILGYHRKTGLIIAVEIKIGKDKLSKEQELFLAGVVRSGGIGVVLRNMDDLETLSFMLQKKQLP